ncbi:MAG: DUF4340 domain-containing protein [Verrucomicrobia bacterium]|jgi:hypothetical protein|nr:DUF4340 domain-containing protein [Verrucomicrobiota bacterium]OQC66490.1 MAG: hypothetical protein BWX48_01578 [Verrucomicrobia bacterium ADurb.Bin006]MDI9379565.1 DUF4340 domain-containing protein [Verrucomicrobiota bacterium]NMD20603.1 DUF4340 domain-containing protein [Verrucomicrobiota bacterium]HNU98404.1 DUF4340 domain-containing protein [Verrucomicrobiota bacterium]
MNAKTTRWLLFLAVALAAFIALFERRTDDTARRAEQAARLLPELVTAEVTALTLTGATNPAIRLERVHDGWEFQSPLRYPAQPAGVDRLLTALRDLRWQGHVTAQELLAHTNGLAAFGFAPPAVSIAIQQGDRPIDLRLGAPTALGGQIYAQVAGRGGLYTVDGAVLKTLPGGVNEWRDTALVRLARRRFDRLQVRPITNGFEVVRSPSNHVWRMVRPLSTRANNARLDLLLDQLELARVIQFVTDDPRADLEPYGLQPPDRELVLSQGTNDILTLQIGRSPANAPDQLFVRRMEHSNVVAVARSSLAPWLASFREFCDRRMMVFDPDAVTRIEGIADGAFALERQTNGTWQIVAPFLASADSVLVLEMLQNLAELEFLEFEREVTTDFVPYGLAPPRRQYVLQTTVAGAGSAPTNQVLAQVGFGNPTGFKYYARRSLDSAVVTIIDNNRLPRAAFELRDRRIWNVSTNQMVSITVHQLGETRKLLRTGPMQWTAPPGDTAQLNPVSLEEAAYRLGQLRADRWVARGEDQLARFGFGTIDHRLAIEVNQDGRIRTLEVRFGRRTLSNQSAYAAVSIEGVEGPVIFECPRSIYEFVLGNLTLVPTLPDGSG